MRSTSEKNLFIKTTSLKARSFFIGKRIDLRELEKKDLLAESPLTLRIGNGCAVIFRYGAVILFNVSANSEPALLKHLNISVANPLEKPEVEEAEIRIQPGSKEGMHDGIISIADGSVKTLQVIAVVLAKSIVLSYYETAIARNFELVEPIALRLRQKGRSAANARELIRHIGEVLMNQHHMVGRIEVAEKPELLWDYPELERLYLRLEVEYEIMDRHRALEQKLELISRTAETVLDIYQTKRTLRVEWYIVILIVMEIFLTLYELFMHA